ncbi:MAG: hypothetical protein M4579_000234 [Chaenotheca gracillima]|nr:MAG: hypothetical protein M4579_000234 [Chaenotheca gracillima]
MPPKDKSGGTGKEKLQGEGRELQEESPPLQSDDERSDDGDLDPFQEQVREWNPDAPSKVQGTAEPSPVLSGRRMLRYRNREHRWWLEEEVPASIPQETFEAWQRILDSIPFLWYSPPHGEDNGAIYFSEAEQTEGFELRNLPTLPDYIPPGVPAIVLSAYKWSDSRITWDDITRRMAFEDSGNELFKLNNRYNMRCSRLRVPLGVQAPNAKPKGGLRTMAANLGSSASASRGRRPRRSGGREITDWNTLGVRLDGRGAAELQLVRGQILQTPHSRQFADPPSMRGPRRASGSLEETLPPVLGEAEATESEAQSPGMAELRPQKRPSSSKHPEDNDGKRASRDTQRTPKETQDSAKEFQTEDELDRASKPEQEEHDAAIESSKGHSLTTGDLQGTGQNRLSLPSIESFDRPPVPLADNGPQPTLEERLGPARAFFRRKTGTDVPPVARNSEYWDQYGIYEEEIHHWCRMRGHDPMLMLREMSHETAQALDEANFHHAAEDQRVRARSGFFRRGGAAQLVPGIQELIETAAVPRPPLIPPTERLPERPQASQPPTESEENGTTSDFDMHDYVNHESSEDGKSKQ